MADHHEHAIAHAREGRWDQAHRLVQDHDDALSCRIHACLHRIEGDSSNARYWYGRAGAEVPEHGVEEELERLATIAREADPSGT